MQKTVIVIPCYNEGTRLPVAALANYFNNSRGISCLLVNDGSTDNTAEVIGKLSLSCKNIDVLHLRANSGKAEAVRQGVLVSLKNAPDFIGYWDADMAIPLESIDSFLTYLNNGQYLAVTGCRISRLGVIIKESPIRHYLGRIFATTVSILLNLGVYDTQCGAKIFKAELAATIFAQPFKTRWLFDVELFKRIVGLFGPEKTNSSILELPLDKCVNSTGSKLKLTAMLGAPFQLIRIFMTK